MKSKSKLWLKILLAVVAAVVLACGITAVVVVSTSISATNIDSYCENLSQRNATKFEHWGYSNFTMQEKKRDTAPLYMLMYAADGDTDKPQELFILKRIRVFGLDFNRYKFVTSSVDSSKNAKASPVGSLKFFPEGQDGKIDTQPTLVIFSSNQDKKIRHFTYTFTDSNGSSQQDDIPIRIGNDGFLYIYPFHPHGGDHQIGKEYGKYSNFRFYDKNEKLVCTLYADEK